MTDILVLVGSLRAASVNRQIADVAAEVAASEGIGAAVYVGLGDVPFYNVYLDAADNADAPAAVVVGGRVRRRRGGPTRRRRSATDPTPR